MRVEEDLEERQERKLKNEHIRFGAARTI